MVDTCRSGWKRVKNVLAASWSSHFLVHLLSRSSRMWRGTSTTQTCPPWTRRPPKTARTSTSCRSRRCLCQWQSSPVAQVSLGSFASQINPPSNQRVTWQQHPKHLHQFQKLLYLFTPNKNTVAQHDRSLWLVMMSAFCNKKRWKLSKGGNNLLLLTFKDLR